MDDSGIVRSNSVRSPASPEPGPKRGTARGASPRDWRRFLLSWFAIPLAALGALVVGAFMLWALGANPFTAYRALLKGAFGSTDGLVNTATKAIPLLLVGVGICIAFRANVLNIGGEGQIVMGGLASTVTALALPDLPGPVLIPLVLLAGAAGGAVWGAIPGALKAYLNVNEILSTIMLNIVAVQLMNYLLANPLIDHTQSAVFARIPQTRRLSPNADLPVLVHGTQLHAGVIVALLAAGAVYVLLWRTGLGFRLRAVGLSREAAAYAGIPVKRTMTLAMTLAGAMSGLAGAILVFGSASHRMVTDGSATGFTGSAGFNGIVAALFGGLSPIFTIASAFIFGGLLVGGNAVQIAVQVPTALIVALNGLVVVFVVSIDHARRRARLHLGVAPDVHGSPSVAPPELDGKGDPGAISRAAPPTGAEPVREVAEE
ncbi:MAG TPA: ABC transporter permease [Actinomycetota bacterium]